MKHKRIKFTDDEAIALAMLHGCTFYEVPGNGPPAFFIDDAISEPYHPLEQKMYEDNSEFFRVGGGWESRGALARNYLKFYKLDLEQPEKVT